MGITDYRLRICVFQHVSLPGDGNWVFIPIYGASGSDDLANMNMSAQTVEIGSLVSRTQGVKGGRPCVAGSGVTIEPKKEQFNHR